MSMSRTRLGIAGLMLLPACSHGSSSAPAEARLPPKLVGAPQLAPNPNAAVPLAAVLSVTTDVPTRVELRIQEGAREWSVDADRNLATEHARVPVLGLRPGREHRIVTTVRDAGGLATTAAEVLSFTAPALPPGFPGIEVVTSRPELMEAGVTLVTINSPAFGDTLIGLDAEGQVVWYFNDPRLLRPEYHTFLAFPLANGSLVLSIDRRALVEIDMLGDVRHAWCAAGTKPRSRARSRSPPTASITTSCRCPRGTRRTSRC
jgi:hypothetical protein